VKRLIDMPDDRNTWIQHFRALALFASFFHLLQFIASVALWTRTGSAALLSFGADAIVSAGAALFLSFRIQREWRNRYAAYGYMAAAALAAFLGASQLWTDRFPSGSVLGIGLAAISMLVIPIIGSYMKVLAVELRSQALKSAAIFTFGNSYLSMVLLIALLVTSEMGLRWGDPAGALIMAPFMAQKGIQILLEEGKHEYVED
jgi:divalent metal cation (Fe/Co/Zn/Cd) transporter